jgi:hypothetical protein
MCSPGDWLVSNVMTFWQINEMNSPTMDITKFICDILPDAKFACTVAVVQCTSGRVDRICWKQINSLIISIYLTSNTYILLLCIDTIVYYVFKVCQYINSKSSELNSRAILSIVQSTKIDQAYLLSIIYIIL